MKLINVFYRGGGGGEFLGSLLTEHRDVVTKRVQYVEESERWYLERTEDDQLSQYYMDGGQPTKSKKWDDSLWNVRLEHGLGFHCHRDFWREYLWYDWKKTKTILLQPKSEDSVKYIDRLFLSKMNDIDEGVGKSMERDGFDVDKWWNEPWKSCQELTQRYMGMIPKGHDYKGIDPYDLFHNNESVSEKTLYTMIDYLELDDSLVDEWLVKIEKYRLKNKQLINRTIV